ncbi:hypothetical protein MRX96_000349 [Rhipicephalus microplus]
MFTNQVRTASDFTATCATPDNTAHQRGIESTQDGTPIPYVSTLSVLGLRVRDLNRKNVTVQKLHAKLSLASRLLKKVATWYPGMRKAVYYDSPSRLQSVISLT